MGSKRFCFGIGRSGSVIMCHDEGLNRMAVGQRILKSGIVGIVYPIVTGRSASPCVIEASGVAFVRIVVIIVETVIVYNRDDMLHRRDVLCRSIAVENDVHQVCRGYGVRKGYAVHHGEIVLVESLSF